MAIAEANGSVRVDSSHSNRTELSKDHDATAVNKYAVMKSLK